MEIVKELTKKQPNTHNPTHTHTHTILCHMIHGTKPSKSLLLYQTCKTKATKIEQAGIEVGLNQAETVSLELPNLVEYCVHYSV